MSTIRQTIENALPSHVLSSYGSYVNTVVTALEQREERAIESLVSGGVSLGASENQIEGLLIDAGLRTAPEPEPTPEPQTVEAMLASLMEKVDGLSSRLDSAASQASRHGIRF